VLKISSGAKISPYADIEDSVRGSKIIIGKGAVIDSFVKIKPVGGIGNVEIGDNAYINACTVIFSGNGVKIGKGVLIAPCCVLAPVNHEYKNKSKTILEQRFAKSKGGIVIGDDVWIGANSTILDGAEIENGVVVGANSIVSGKLEAYCIYVGNPLKKIGKRE
jgi:acetyltransferase-like isoleucine patch superfamily enzyme